jgi:hypothetical protein
MPSGALAASLDMASVAAVSEYRKGGSSHISVSAAQKPTAKAMQHASRMMADTKADTGGASGCGSELMAL